MLIYNKNSASNTRDGILRYAIKIPKVFKEVIKPYLTPESKYAKGKVMGLRNPLENGLGMGADKNGFFMHTHRGRSKSFPTPESIPAKDIKWVESTG